MKDFLKSIGDFFTKDIPAGLDVISKDVVHLAGTVGHIAAGSVGTFVAVNEIAPLKQYLTSGGALTVSGVTTVLVAGLLTGLLSIAGKAPDNSPLKIAATFLTPEEIQQLSTQAGSSADKVVAAVKAKSEAGNDPKPPSSHAMGNG